MKSKLLKKLRAKFKVEYFPSTKKYKVSGKKESYHNKRWEALAQRDCDMINYGRYNYEKYSKRIRI